MPCEGSAFELVCDTLNYEVGAYSVGQILVGGVVLYFGYKLIAGSIGNTRNQVARTLAA